MTSASPPFEDVIDATPRGLGKETPADTVRVCCTSEAPIRIWLATLALGTLAACTPPEGLIWPMDVGDVDLAGWAADKQPVFWPYGVQGGGHPEGHRGWDIDAPEGALVLATGAGRIARAGACGDGTPCSFGHFVILELDDAGATVGYHHTGPPEVEAGDRVEAGDVLAPMVTYERHPVVHFDVAVGWNKQCPEPFMAPSALEEAERWRALTHPDPEVVGEEWIDGEGRYAQLCWEL